MLSVSKMTVRKPVGGATLDSSKKTNDGKKQTAGPIKNSKVGIKIENPSMPFGMGSTKSPTQ